MDLKKKLATIAFLNGFCVMAIEVGSARLLQPFLGSSHLVWTHILGTIIGSMAIGYWLGEKRKVDSKSLSVNIGALYLWATLSCVWLFFLPGVLEPIFLAEFFQEQVVMHQKRLAFFGFISTMVFVSPVVIFLSMLSPRILNFSVENKTFSAGGVLAINTLGCLTGVYLSHFLLIELLGSQFLIYSVAMVLIGLFLINARLKIVSLFWRAAPLVVLLGMSFQWVQSSNDSLRWIGSEVVLMEKESPYQHIRVAAQMDESMELPESVYLMINEGFSVHSQYHFNDSYEAPFPYSLMPELVSMDSKKKKNVLVLGSAAGTLSRTIAERGEELQLGQLKNVEIDPEIIKLEKLFGFDSEKYPNVSKTIASDALNFVRSTKEKFDVIFIDTYQDNHSIPFHLVTREFFQQINQKLTPNGIVVLNWIDMKNEKSFESMVATAALSIGEPIEVTDHDSDNHLLVFSKNRKKVSQVKASIQKVTKGQDFQVNRVSVNLNAKIFRIGHSTVDLI